MTRTVSAITRTPFGSVRVRADDEAVVEVSWAGRRAPTDVPNHPVLRQAVDELGRFATGELREFTVPIDFGELGGFRRRVLEILEREVGFGETVTYGELAAMAGNPGAARAVGTAMNRNPLPILVPCHRVLASTGIGGFGPGVSIKRRMLEHEGVAI